MSQQINLFNPIFLKQKRYFSAQTMLVALTLLVAGLGSIYGYAYWQLAHLRAEVAQMTELAAAEEQRMQLLKEQVELRKRAPELEAEVRRAEAELDRVQQLVRLIEQEFAKSGTGISHYLAALARQHRDGLWLTEGAFDGDLLMLKGKMVRREALPAYLERLSEEEPFRGHSFARIEVIAETGAGSEEKGRTASRLEFLLSTKSMQ